MWPDPDCGAQAAGGLRYLQIICTAICGLETCRAGCRVAAIAMQRDTSSPAAVLAPAIGM